MPRDVMRRVFRRLRHMPEEIDSPRRKALTSREKEILTQFAKGMSYSAIAESRGNRSSTVRNTIHHHTGQAGIRHQAGGHRLGRAKRTGGLKARLNFFHTNSPNASTARPTSHGKADLQPTHANDPSDPVSRLEGQPRGIRAASRLPCPAGDPPGTDEAGRQVTYLAATKPLL